MDEAGLNFPTVFPELLTERLQLLPFDLSETAVFFGMRSKPSFMRYLGLHPMKKLEEAEKHIRMLMEDFNTQKGIPWKICLKSNGKMIGYMGLWNLSYRHARSEIGFGIAEEFQSKGYGSEAMKAVLDYSFEKFQLHSIKADVDPLNIASVQLLVKNGFQKEAHFRENYFFNGEFLDSDFYCIIKSDWQIT